MGITVSTVNGIKKSDNSQITSKSFKMGIDLKMMGKIDEMSRDELKDYLKENNIEFKGNAKTETLVDLAKETCR